MSQGGLGAIGAIWAAIGFVMAMLDLVDVVQFGFIGMAATQCAQSGNIACLPGTLETMILFMVDVLIGPILLAANLMTNPFLGIIGVALGLVILYFTFGKGGGLSAV